MAAEDFCYKVSGKKANGKYNDIKADKCESGQSPSGDIGTKLMKCLTSIIPVDETNYTVQTVLNYIDTLKKDLKNFENKKLSEVDVTTIIDSMLILQPEGDYVKKKEEMVTAFQTVGENNQISLIFEAYKMQNVIDEKEPKKLEAIHDGWTLARLITVTSTTKKFEYVYKTSEEEAKFTKTINLNTTDQAEQDFINKLLNKSEDKDLDAILRKYRIKIDFNVDSKEHSTIIRADQLRMLVPYDNLLVNDQNADKPFLKNFAENIKPTLESVWKLFPQPAAEGGSRKSTPTQTNKRIQHGGKNRIVYKGKRGGEYIKQGGEYIPLSKLK